MNNETKDKAVFIIGFLAIFIALTTFKDSLAKITIPFGIQTYTIWGLIVFLVSVLVISVYLYALSYLWFFDKYKEKIFVKWIFKGIVFLANFFYSVALIFPLLIIFISLLKTSPLGSFAEKHFFGLMIFDTIGVLIIVISSLLNARFLSKLYGVQK